MGVEVVLGAATIAFSYCLFGVVNSSPLRILVISIHFNIAFRGGGVQYTTPCTAKPCLR